MMHCLDTNVVIAVLKKHPPRLIERFRFELVRGVIAVPAIVMFELQYGAAKSDRRAENEDRLAIFLGAPITVLSCDNLQSNGDVTRSVVTEFLHASAARPSALTIFLLRRRRDGATQFW